MAKVPRVGSIFMSSPQGGALNALLKDEPMVDEQMGRFSDIEVPVAYFPGAPQYWGMSMSDREYLIPQSQEEHNRLLNTYYNTRMTNPRWKEMGRAAEAASPHYSDKDATIRKNVNAASSVIRDIGYDKDNNLAMLKIGNKWTTYSATPWQFANFLSSGSLGREMNNIKNGRSSSMLKTSANKIPYFRPGNKRITSIFGF